MYIAEDFSLVGERGKGRDNQIRVRKENDKLTFIVCTVYTSIWVLPCIT